MFSIRAEGWRFIPHSYAMLNQWQCLELMRRDDVELYFRDAPFVFRQWRQVRNLMPPKWEEAIANLPDSVPRQPLDAVVRLFVPVSFKRSFGRRTMVLGTADFGWLPNEMIEGGRTLAEAHRESDVIILSPSEWSKWGLLRAGADPDRVKVVHLGVDVNVFCPASPVERASQRARAGYGDRFVFLNVSAQTLSKGTDLLLKAFARVASQREMAFLVLKGTDKVYGSNQILSRWLIERLTEHERRAIDGRTQYIGTSLSVNALATIYQAADAYVTPYRSEAFNMPVLEAAACGLPVICTAGGPTDEFTTTDFAQRISAELVPGNRASEVVREPDLDELSEAMLRLIDDRAFITKARSAGPAHARDHFTWKHTVDRLLEVAGAPV